MHVKYLYSKVKIAKYFGNDKHELCDCNLGRNGPWEIRHAAVYFLCDFCFLVLPKSGALNNVVATVDYLI